MAGSGYRRPGRAVDLRHLHGQARRQVPGKDFLAPRTLSANLAMMALAALGLSPGATKRGVGFSLTFTGAAHRGGFKNPPLADTMTVTIRRQAQPGP
jgi:hypothetical protein